MGGARRQSVVAPSSVAYEDPEAGCAYCFPITETPGDADQSPIGPYLPVVTVSASYGAGGSFIAPRLAHELGVPFVDRLISADMSQDAARTERLEQAGTAAARAEEGLSEGEETMSTGSRFLSYFARAASVGAMHAPDTFVDDDEGLRARVLEGLKEIRAGAPAVVLGRAGAVVLGARPRAYHVRLDGPTERRLAWAAQFEHVSAAAASRRQAETDRARTQFVKRLYRVDPTDAKLYHLVLDPTVLGIDAAVTVIITAARSFFEANPDP